MFKHQVQGFVVGAAVMGALLLAPPILGTSNDHADLDAFAASVGVDIVWTDIQPCDLHGTKPAGCFWNLTPGMIYVTPRLSAAKTRYVVLHEISHALQSRLGIEGSECAADQIARLLSPTSTLSSAGFYGCEGHH